MQKDGKISENRIDNFEEIKGKKIGWSYEKIYYNDLKRFMFVFVRYVDEFTACLIDIFSEDASVENSYILSKLSPFENYIMSLFGAE